MSLLAELAYISPVVREHRRWCRIRAEAQSSCRLRPVQGPTALRPRFPRSASTRSPTHRNSCNSCWARASSAMMAVVKNADENLHTMVNDEASRRPFTQDGTGIRCHLHLIVGASQTDNVIATFITYSASIPVISFQYRFKQSPINMAVCTIRREYSFVVAYMVKSSSWHGSWFAPPSPLQPQLLKETLLSPALSVDNLAPSASYSHPRRCHRLLAPGTQVDDAAPPTPHWWLKKRPMSAHENTYDGLRARPLTWDLIFGKVARARKTGIWQTSTNQFRGESTTAYHWTPLGWGYWRSLPVFLIAI
ncbi:hypothetical protein BGY98DRAFT_1100489 [Russula aff. rugulosa BPL654]|nr:hypothetical protein BGY98DRAFT_1100489 [Russula aff. rugulosa BPL654]